MSFDEVVQGGWRSEGAVWRRDGFPSSWLQGRTLFGGAATAAVVRALGAQVSPDRPLRSVFTSFVGPVVDAPATLHTEVLRAGKGATQLAGELRQQGGVRTRVSALYGRPRASRLARTPPLETLNLPPAESRVFPFLPGVTPDFTQHIAMRWASGAMPFSGASEASLSGWCQHRTAATDPATALLGLLDAWPCPALSLLTAPAPASSVTWHVTFVHLPERVDPERWWGYTSRVTSLADGFAHMASQLSDDGGRVVALSEQVVAVYG